MTLKLVIHSNTEICFENSNYDQATHPPIVKQFSVTKNDHGTYTVKFIAGSAAHLTAIRHTLSLPSEIKMDETHTTTNDYPTSVTFTSADASHAFAFFQAVVNEHEKYYETVACVDAYNILKTETSKLEKFLKTSHVKNLLLTTTPNLYKIPASNDCQYMVLRYFPGPGNPLYSERKEEWAEKGFTGCTSECQHDIDNIHTYSEHGIAVKLISTMTENEEATARANRTFETPQNSATFSIVNDPEGNYETFYPKHRRVAINSGQQVYPPHVVILRKIDFNPTSGTWAGEPIGIIDRKNNPEKKTILDVVQADIAARRSNVNVHEDRKVQM